MRKLINPNDYIRLSTYADKYGINKKKLYRYINNDFVDIIMIDTVPFIKDMLFDVLQKDNRLKITVYNVPNETLDNSKSFDNQEVNNVLNETIRNVPNETLQERLKELELIPEKDRKIIHFKEIEEIRNKIN